MIPVTSPELPPLEEFEKYLVDIWESRWLTNRGKFLRLLEERLKKYLGARNLLLLSNGSLAIHLAIKALDLKGEVITTPFTFAATTNVLVWEGLTPVFVDIDRETLNIDPDEIEGKINGKTSAIIPVHAFGNPSAMKQIDEIAEEYGIKVIHDGAQAFAVEYLGNPIVNYGDISTLSFHATKVFNTVEGGATITREPEIQEKIGFLANHGITSEDTVSFAGTNAKMNEIQASFGLSLLDSIDDKMQKRKSIYEYYMESLSETGIEFQKLTASKYNYSYMPVILESERDLVYEELMRKGIQSKKYFYPLTSEFEYFRKGKKAEDSISATPIAFDISRRILCLPIFGDMSFDTVDKIVNIIKKSITVKH